MSHRALFLAWVLGAAGALVPLRGQDRAAEDSTLTAIDTLIRNGSYLSAEVEGRRLLDRPALPDSVRAQGEKYVAFCLVAEGDQNSARSHFILALRADSTLTLDPVMTSPKILTVFREAQTALAAGQRAASTPPVERPPAYGRPVTWRAIVFPGWEQVHQGRSTNGYVLLTLGAGAVLATIASDVGRRSARSDYLAARTAALATQRYDRYNTWQKAEYYSAAAFGTVFVYSMIDSFVGLPPSLDLAAMPGTSRLLALRVTF